MDEKTEFMFIVKQASLFSEFGYCWAKKSDARQQHVLRLDGYFDIQHENRSGVITLVSEQDFPTQVADQIDEDVPISKQLNIGTVELRKLNPNACLQVTHDYLIHIWEISSSENQQLEIEIRTVESVLEVRNVESISAEVTRISSSPRKKIW